MELLTSAGALQLFLYAWLPVRVSVHIDELYMLQYTQTTNDVNLIHSSTGGGNVWRCDAMLEQQRGMSLAFVFFLYFFLQEISFIF